MHLKSSVVQKSVFIFIICGISLVNAQAQFKISGTVTDSKDTIVTIGDALLFNAIDNTMVKYAVLSNEGFLLENIKKGSYRLKVSSLGYEPYEETFYVGCRFAIEYSTSGTYYWFR